MVIVLLLRTLVVLVVMALPVRVTTGDGKTFQAELTSVGESTVTVSTSEGSNEISFEDLESIASSKFGDGNGPPLRVNLAGGSQIAAENVFSDGENLVIQTRQPSQIRIPLKQVQSIRFRAASPATDPQWLGLLEKDARGDTLALRREGDRLDPVEGMVESIADGRVTFDLEGEKARPSIEILEGIIFGGVEKHSLPSDVLVTDVFGSRFAALSLQPSNENEPLAIRLSSEVVHHVPLEQIDSIRWSGSMVLLATQAPASRSYQPYVQTKISSDLLNGWFGPASKGEDILMNGTSDVEFRIDEGFATLAGSVQRQNSVAAAGEVIVEISLDDKVVWKEILSDMSPRGFEIPLPQARRCKIHVDSGNDGDVGDMVRITRPRLLK